MRLSQLFGKTLRQAPAEAEMISHQLLLRGGFVRPLSAGIYTYLPLGYRVLRKLWVIMVEEMDKIGGQEMWMPNLHPAAIWQTTGRWHSLDVLMKVQTGGSREYAISPTHEEVVNDLTLREIESYRDLPRFIYHISKKFRNEARPRGGLIRLREFVMKDAYTLDTDEAALDRFYPAILQAYQRIFDRCHVPARPIQADVGAMGGKSSHEFTVPHPQGEDTFIACQSCDYAANVEAAQFVRQGAIPESLQPLTKVPTPHTTTIADLANLLQLPTSQTIKAVFYWATDAGTPEAQGRFVFAIVRGDLEINEIKLSNALGGKLLRPATDEEIQATGAIPGYASPIGLAVAANLNQDGVIVVADLSIQAGGNFAVGANEVGYHYIGANYPRDHAVTLLADIAQADTGHQCPYCGGQIAAQRGIEVGHCFKLGTRYSAAANAFYLDESNQPQLIYMGSYGIGLDRLMAVIVEEHHDQDGIVWPSAIAPYQVHLIHLGKEPTVPAFAQQLYELLQQKGVEVLYDDRDVTAGIKFKDADLIGIPIRLTLSGRGLAQNQVEIKYRHQSARITLDINQLWHSQEWLALNN